MPWDDQAAGTSCRTRRKKRNEGFIMYRKNIAVLFGGHSTEYDVSLQPAAAVLSHIPGDRYKVFSIGITRDGDWYHYTGAVSNIAEGRWCEEAACLHPVVFSQNRSVGGFLERHDGGYTVQKLDLAFPVLHGKNGEDGTVQGLLELAAQSGSISNELLSRMGPRLPVVVQP